MRSEIRSFTFAKQIFHSGAISHGGAIFHSPKANFVEKSTHCLGRQMCAFFLVGDGGFGPPKSVTTDLQSAPFGRSGNPPYIGCRYYLNRLELVNGVEPSTC